VRACEVGPDISFNLISVADVQGTPVVEMDWDDFIRPIENAVRSHFLMVKAAVPHMARRGDGVVLFFGGSGDPVPNYSIGGFQMALHGVEAMRRQYSSELGSAGGPLRDAADRRRAGHDRRRDGRRRGTRAELERSDDDRARGDGAVAAFGASNKARTVTAATVNVSAGALIDS
jgi:3-oxoacyl-[acyl-carrier protein] reductase